MKNFKLKAFIFILFFIKGLFSVQYKNVIELSFRPEKSSLEDLKNKDFCPYDNSCYIQKSSPIKNYSNNPSSSDGFNIFFENKSQKSCAEMRYCLEKKILNRSIRGISGVFCFYSGYAAISDNDGLVILPSLELENELTIVVTNSINPVKFSKNIPAYFKVNQDENSSWYKCIGTKKNGMVYWEIKNIEAPEDLKIPENALVINGDPEFVTFEKEPQVSAFFGNIIVPTFYLNEKFTRGIYYLNNLDNFEFYEPQKFKIMKNTNENNSQYAKLS